MYAIYGNIYHQYTPNVSIYTSTMDPSWVMWLSLSFQKWGDFTDCYRGYLPPMLNRGHRDPMTLLKSL